MKLKREGWWLMINDGGWVLLAVTRTSLASTSHGTYQAVQDQSARASSPTSEEAQIGFLAWWWLTRYNSFPSYISYRLYQIHMQHQSFLSTSFARYIHFGENHPPAEIYENVIVHEHQMCIHNTFGNLNLRFPYIVSVPLNIAGISVEDVEGHSTWVCPYHDITTTKLVIFPHVIWL